MPLRLDEIKEVQEIAMIAAKTSSMTAFVAVMESIAKLDKRIADLEKPLTSNSPTKQGKEKAHA